jgi:S1-C subfamily serine protease
VAIKAIILSSMLLVGAASVHAQTPLGDLVSEVKRATVVVTSYDINGKNLGQASGFLIAPDRVLTNVRSIDSARLIRINTFNGKSILVQGVIARYVGADLAILQLSEVFLDVVPLKVKTISRAQGSSIVLNNSEAEWRVTPALDGGWSFEHIATHLQIAASLAESDSGAPVVKLQGYVNGTAVTIP